MTETQAIVNQQRLVLIWLFVSFGKNHVKRIIMHKKVIILLNLRTTTLLKPFNEFAKVII